MTQVIDERFAAQFLDRFHGAVNAHDAPAIVALCHEDVVWEDPAAPHTLHGPAEVLSFHADTMFPALPNARVELIDGPYLSVTADSIAVRLRISGRMEGGLNPPGFAATMQNLSFETAEFSTFKDGLLARHVVVLDMLDLARQIGAIPEAGTPADRVGRWLQHVSALRARRRRD